MLVASLLLFVVACGEAAGGPDAGSDAGGPGTTRSTEPPATTSATTTTVAAATTTAASPAPAGPGYGGVVVIGDDQQPPTLNPYAPGGEHFIVSIVGQAIHTGAWDIDAGTLQRIPEVVVELPTVGNGGVTVNEDGTMTVRYVIRDEARWADGTPISGDDFAFTYETLTTPEIAAAPGDRFAPYDLIDGDSLEIGAKTFAFTMAHPTLSHEELFAWLIPRHQVDGTDVLNDWNTQPWMSGGPFVVDTWDRGGSDGVTFAPGRLTLVRNDNYWKTHRDTGDPLPYLDGVVFEFIPETESILRAFAARELDVINPPPFVPELERALGEAAASGAEVIIDSGPVWEHLSFQFGELNRNADSFNRYLPFRRAVAHAIDRQALAIEAQHGFGEPLGSYLDVFIPGLSTGAWNRYAYDPAEARRLLTELCAELGRDCNADPPVAVLSTTSNADLRPRIADFLVAALGEVGIEVALDLEDSQLYFGRTLNRGDYDVGLWAWVGQPGYAATVAIHDVFDPDAPPLEGSNYYRWGTPATAGALETGPEGEYDVDQGPSTVVDEHTARFAELVDLMSVTVDEATLDDLILEAEEILADQVVIIPLFSRPVAAAYWADEIAGFQINPTQASHTWNIEEWYRVDR